MFKQITYLVVSTLFLSLLLSVCGADGIGTPLVSDLHAPASGSESTQLLLSDAGS